MLTKRGDKVPAIYRIRNVVNGRCYIGQTRNLRDRKAGHLNKIRDSRHSNPLINRDIEAFGPLSFVFETIAVCEECDLNFIESALIASTRPAYNRMVGGGGRKHFTPDPFRHEYDTDGDDDPIEIPSGSMLNFVDARFQSGLRDSVHAALVRLGVKERETLDAAFGLSGSEMTPTELSKKYGISRQAIDMRLKSGLTKMRRYLSSDYC